MGKEEAILLRQDGVEIVWELYEGVVCEIAEEYNLSNSTVYRIMQEFCNEHGRIYRDFLRFPHKPHVIVNGKIRFKRAVTPKNTKPKKGKLKFKRIPIKSTDENVDTTYISELLKSSKTSDVLEGINLLESLINTVIANKEVK